MDSPQDDPFFQHFFARISKAEAESFSDAQLAAIKRAFGARSRGVHPLDLRFSVPLIFARVYLVMLGGPEHRPSDRRQRERALRPIWRFANAIVLVVFLMMFAGSLFTLLYTGKRAFGIDIVPGIDMLDDTKMERALE